MLVHIPVLVFLHNFMPWGYNWSVSYSPTICTFITPLFGLLKSNTNIFPMLSFTKFWWASGRIMPWKTETTIRCLVLICILVLSDCLFMLVWDHKMIFGKFIRPQVIKLYCHSFILYYILLGKKSRDCGIALNA